MRDMARQVPAGAIAGGRITRPDLPAKVTEFRYAIRAATDLTATPAPM